MWKKKKPSFPEPDTNEQIQLQDISESYLSNNLRMQDLGCASNK